MQTTLQSVLTHWSEMPNAAMQAEVPQGGWTIDWEGYNTLLAQNNGDKQETYLVTLEAAVELLKTGDTNQASYFYAQAMAFKANV